MKNKLKYKIIEILQDVDVKKDYMIPRRTSVDKKADKILELLKDKRYNQALIRAKKTAIKQTKQKLKQLKEELKELIKNPD